jgi:hypothetical protein
MEFQKELNIQMYNNYKILHYFALQRILNLHWINEYYQCDSEFILGSIESKLMKINLKLYIKLNWISKLSRKKRIKYIRQKVKQLYI